VLAEPQSAALSPTIQRTGWLLAVVLSLFAPSAKLLAQFGTTANGAPVRTLAPVGTRAVALFFVASDCPISDRTFPEMKRLREQFTPRGVKFYFVYPNSTEHRGDITTHQQAFDPGGEILLDPAGNLVRLTHAQVTPEAAILLPHGDQWFPVYTGRIDDRYIHLGLERPRPTHIFAEEALNAVLSNKPAPKPTGTPVGCSIVNSSLPPEKSRGSH
jgi:hypothetical protein